MLGIFRCVERCDERCVEKYTEIYSFTTFWQKSSAQLQKRQKRAFEKGNVVSPLAPLFFNAIEKENSRLHARNDVLRQGVKD
mmetsp:Transcript_23615/g.32982  ORF Transcript_23615/g.32982 Transcript_23615/m.32982 type:complete len:82 (+) Transcript_23615:886-1131(+)